MTILLVSDDPYLLDLCRRALQALCGDDFTLFIGQPDNMHIPVDVRIYDIDNVSGRSDLLDGGISHQDVFIVDRERVESLGETFPGILASILLKPVTEGPLRLCLGQALKRCGPIQSDSKALLQFMLEAIVKLQEYDQDRTNFLARGMHDFRAPLTALKGYCGLLLDQQLGLVQPYQAEVLTRMKHSIDRLSRMAEDMFQLSVGNRFDFKPDLQEADFSACLDQAVHELTPFIDEKRISLTVDVQPPPDPMCFDPSQIEQVLINVLDNACKFTPRRGSIEINGYPCFSERRHAVLSALAPGAERRRTTVYKPNAYRIDICDSGPAIPPSQLLTIFEEYTSCGGDQDRSGAGLGLAICKLIISRHNGRIWAESNGERTVFSFVLPFARSEPSQPEHNGPSDALIRNDHVEHLSLSN